MVRSTHSQSGLKETNNERPDFLSCDFYKRCLCEKSPRKGTLKELDLRLIKSDRFRSEDSLKRYSFSRVYNNNPVVGSCLNCGKKGMINSQGFCLNCASKRYFLKHAEFQNQ